VGFSRWLCDFLQTQSLRPLCFQGKKALPISRAIYRDNPDFHILPPKNKGV
jgi:hypothetical protein